MQRKQHVKQQRTFAITMGVLLILVIAIFSTIVILWQSRKPMQTARKQTIQIAKEAGIKDVDKFYSSNLNETYYTVSGKDKTGKKKYVIVPKNGGTAVTLRYSQGITASSARTVVKNYKSLKKILNVGLTIEKEHPYWNVSYVNNQNKLCFANVTFKSGKIQKVIENI